MLLAAAAVALLRGSLHRRGPELALALLLPAYLVHALVDIDWDFVAVAPRRSSPRARSSDVPGASGACAASRSSPRPGARSLVFGAFLLPWLGAALGGRGAGRRRPRARVTLANRAQARRPAAGRAVLDLAFAAEQPGKPQRAYDLYVAAPCAGSREPADLAAAGEYAFAPRLPYQRVRQPRALHRARPVRRGVDGGDDYNAALKLRQPGRLPLLS